MSAAATAGARGGAKAGAPRGPARPGTPAPRGGRSAARTAAWLALAAALFYAASGGGRVVGSDEVTMLELSRALLRGSVEVPEGATMPRPARTARSVPSPHAPERAEGAFVTKNAAAQAVLALPLVALGEAAAAGARLEPARRALAVRFVASFFNALVSALVLAACYWTARRLGVSRGAALAAAAMLGFTTPLWVYAKSFMAEPLQALGLLLALAGASLAGDADAAAAAGGRARPERLAALGAFVAISAKLSMLPLALACLVPLFAAPPRRWAAPAFGVAAALAGHALYNLARFGTPLETGYGAQATAAAYTTPLAVGVYGLLISSGKGLMWFAPVLWLAPAGARAAARGAGGWGRRMWGTPAGRATLGAWLALAVALLLYGTFQHWAGDGSFGPRYLVPLLPLLVLPVAFALEGAARARRALAWALALAGLVVQLGGVGIYFGAQMREAGDYPYRLPLDHPRFMSDSHFNPRFSPIAGHWRMLGRNAARHLRGEAPVLSTAGATDPRLGIAAESQRALLGAIDLWWLYLGYAGVPAAPVALAVAALLAAAAWAAHRLRAAWRAEGDAA